MKPAREVIADWLEGRKSRGLCRSKLQTADFILAALEDAGYVVVSNRNVVMSKYELELLKAEVQGRTERAMIEATKPFLQTQRS